MVNELAKKPEPTTPREAGRPSQADELTLITAKNAAIIGFASLNMTVISLLGPNCAATSAERDVAITAFQGMLEGMTPDQAVAVAKVLNPAQLIAVAVSWGFRIYRIKSEEADEGGPGPSSGPAPVVPPEDSNHREKKLEPEEPVLEAVLDSNGKPLRAIPIDELKRVPGTGMDGRS